MHTYIYKEAIKPVGGITKTLLQVSYIYIPIIIKEGYYIHNRRLCCVALIHKKSAKPSQ